MVPPVPEEPNVFDFDNLGTFLTVIAAHRRRARQSWTFGVWARQLGLDNVATLTRLVNGDRIPGDRLLERLEHHFGFNEHEREYFRLLAHLGRAEADQALKAALQRRLRELSMARLTGLPVEAAERDARAPLLVLTGERILALWGQAPLDVANRVLAPEGIEAVPLGGAAVVGIVATAAQSALGPYTDLYVAVVASRRGGELDSSGLYFMRLVTASQRVATYWRMIWGVPYAAADVNVEVGRARASREGTSVAELTMGDAPCAPVEEHNDLLGLAPPGEPTRSRYRLHLDMYGEARAFDPGLDTYTVAADGPLAPFLALQFRPQLWRRYDRFTCGVYAPEPF